MMRLIPNSQKLLGTLRRHCVRMMATDGTDGDSMDSDANRRPERGMNRVTLIGRVGREPELRGTDEYPCVVFPLATNLSFRKANGEQMTKTDWHRICVFKPGLRDNVANRIGRGDRVFVEGAISYTRFTDNDNKNTVLTSIVADDMMILARRQNSQVRSEEGEEMVD
ncbi:single-stranded DNA-binding protein [Plakobranchus ocellatus]|uniref:Single-stranded DNA-binding protein n=1 Tax=Plakobranchus ocellatus TaxID=259542 RepID=A0AAV4A9L8_9GAST|nr:single-stranded DNA-binding protein [Plakobranchus ocellatus]